MDQDKKVTSPQNNISSNKTNAAKDIYAKLSLVLGLTSILFSWIGAIPLAAIILGIIGIIKTKEPGTGRWMAVAGLVLGTLFLLINAQMNNHFNLQNTNFNNDPKLVPSSTEQQERVGSNLVRAELHSINKSNLEYTIRITNKSDVDIRAYEGVSCIYDAFGKEYECRIIKRYDPLTSKEYFDVTIFYGTTTGISQLMNSIENYENVTVTISDTNVVLFSD